MRSWLFVPGDSDRKLARAVDAGADVVILDLEDSVAPSAKQAARDRVRDFIESACADLRRSALFVRVNAQDSGLARADLDAVVRPGLAGILLPKSRDGRDIARLDAMLAVREAEAGLPDLSIRVAAIATESTEALFGLASYRGASPRLEALAWGGEDLATDLGAASNRGEDGSLTDPFRLARSLCLAGAVAAGVQPVDTVFTDYRDLDGLRAEAESAARDGFTGKLAIHPDQVPVINAAFTPSVDAVAEARRIVAAFEADPGAGVVALDGRMVDRPHLLRATRLIARADWTVGPKG